MCGFSQSDVRAGTLVLHPGTVAGVLQELQDERLHDIGAAMESCQDVEQPPSSLTAVPAQIHAQTGEKVSPPPAAVDVLSV